MKIVSWNLKNIGANKLNRQFSPTVRGYGLGNTVQDFIVNLVAGGAMWNNVADLSVNPADVFVIIELKTGGYRKGYPISGTCIPTLTALTNALNTNVNNRFGNLTNYRYSYAVPVITGRHETVGVIYNNRRLLLLSFHAFRNNNNNNWINPRTPAGAQLQIQGTTNAFQVVGIHAPPPKGSGDLRYRPPIQYCNFLDTTNPAGMADSFFSGDFNCAPNDYYVRNIPGGTQDVYPLTAMDNLNYETWIPDGTLSSVRRRIAQAYYPNEDSYMSEAYDNMITNRTFVNNPDQVVVDMIGHARNMNGFGNPLVWGSSQPTSRSLLSAYNSVSDHMPVVLEW